MSKTVALHTLGCKLNFSETSSLTRLLEQEGYEKKSFDELADVYVINTCSVTDNADKECRHLVRRIQRKAPSAMVVVTGCYAQLKPEEIAKIDGVDLVLGAAEKFNIVQHLDSLTKQDPVKICSCDINDVSEFHSAFSVNDRTRTFLKVQDGCNYNCSFCTIPGARGKSRSDSIANVVYQAQELAKAGVKEIVLTGINLGDFGNALPITKPSVTLPSHKGEEENFLLLLRELEKIDGLRYRISSIEPNLLSHRIIELVAQSDKLMPHFHIPLQSGSDKILGMMRRRYKKELYLERVNYIKKLIPHAAIGVDVIAGFPGETEADFNETLDFLHSMEIAYLHVFTYSERNDTAALLIKPTVPLNIRNQRNKILRNLSWQKLQYFTNLHLGQVRPVLFEHSGKNGMMEGYTDNYIKISTPFKSEWHNQVIPWKI